MTKSDDKPTKIEPGVYRHNKSGRQYDVIGTALHTETDEVLVIYRPLYASEHELFARPHAMFIELIEINGQMMPRFEKADTPRAFLA